MRFITPTTYNLPSLRYLRKRRLLWTVIAVAIFYVLYAAFAVSTTYTFLNHQGYYYTDDIFVLVFSPLIFAGVGVLVHLRRFVLAMSTKYQALKGGTVVPNYEVAISPIEASVLIDARNEGELGYLLLDDAQSAGALSAWRHGGKIHVQHVESDAKLAYYTQVFVSYLFANAHKVELTDREFRRSQAVKQAEKAIYQRMIETGYLSKMNWFQEFVYGYSVVCLVLLSYPAYLAAVAIMAVQFIGLVFGGPRDIIPNTDNSQMVLAVGGLIALIVVPIIMALFSAYSTKGSRAFREVFGLYWFLKVAYSGRFNDRDFLSQDDQKKYMPYAKAFGIINTRA